MRPNLSLALLAAPLLIAAAPAPAAHPELSAIAGEVRQDRLEATIRRLVAFGTRHTLSDRTSDTRGIGAAERWTASEFEAMSKACGGCQAGGWARRKIGLSIIVPERRADCDRSPYWQGEEGLPPLSWRGGPGGRTGRKQ